jgi:hypothetical protein
LADLGDEANGSTAKLMLIELVRWDVYLLDECDKRICKILYKAGAKEKKLGPKFIGLLYSYRSGIARSLSSNLLALGLEKAPPKVKSLEEILAEEPEEKDGQEWAGVFVSVRGKLACKSGLASNARSGPGSGKRSGEDTTAAGTNGGKRSIKGESKS